MSRTVLAFLLLGALATAPASFAGAQEEGDKTTKDEPKEEAKEETKSEEKDATKDEDKQADPEPPHPQPRVRVDVLASKGSIQKDAIQAAARRNFWSKAVLCYRKGAYLEQTLKVDTSFSIEVVNGKARVSSKKKKGRVHKRSAAAKRPLAIVEACILDAFSGLEMPKGKKTSAKIRVRIKPGDEPVPPPVSEKKS